MNCRIRNVSVLMFLCLMLSAQTLSAQSCTVDATPMSFGGLESSPGPAVDSAGSISVHCDATTNYLISLDAGLYSNGKFTKRKMSLDLGSGFMDYNLFRDASRTQIWGDGTGGSSSVQGSSPGGVQSIPLYGRIGAGQNLSIGNYSDIITVTIDW